MESTPSALHTGRKIQRIRELKGLKQETLAAQMNVARQAISRIEQSESIDDDTLGKVAKALGVTPETIKNFSEDAVINYFNNFHDHSTGDFRHHCTFNVIDKVVELYDHKVALLERLLQSEKDKYTALEMQLTKNKPTP